MRIWRLQKHTVYKILVPHREVNAENCNEVINLIFLNFRIISASDMSNSMKIGRTSSSSIGEAATGCQQGIAPPAPEVVLEASIVESLEGFEPTSGSTCSRSSVEHMPSESTTSLSTVVNFYMVCLIGPLALFGIAGNVLSVYILRRDRGARAMSLLLQALSIGNALLLAIAFFVRTIPDVYFYTNSPLLETYIDYVYVFGMPYFTIAYDVVHMFIVYIILYAAYLCFSFSL